MANNNSKYNQVCKRCGRYCGGTCSDDVFTTLNRSASNGGYTQQNTKDSNTIYTGADHSADNNDIFFSAEKFAEEREANSKSSKLVHDPNDNPYDNNVYAEHKWHVQTNTHTDEFKPTDMVEFSNHRFGSEASNKLRFNLFGVIGCTLLSMFFVLIIDKTHLSYPITFVYTAVMVLLTYTLLRSFNKNIMFTIVGTTITYAITLAAILIKTHLMPLAEGFMTPLNFLMIYTPVVAQLVFCVRSYRAFRFYLDRWDAYTVQGVYVNQDKVDPNYELFGENSADNTDKQNG